MSIDSIRAAFSQRTIFGSLQTFLASAADGGVIDQAERNALLEAFEAHRDYFTPAAVLQLEGFRESTKHQPAVPVMQDGSPVASAITGALYAREPVRLEQALTNYKNAVRAGYQPRGVDEGLLLAVVGATGGARVVKMLLDAGLSANASQTSGFEGKRSALHLALLRLARAPGGSPGATSPEDAEVRDVVKLLLDAGADVNAQDRAGLPGQTPLHLLASSNAPLAVELAKLLLERGANPSLRAENFMSDDVFRARVGQAGDTALDVAKRAGNSRLVALLEAFGAKPANSAAEAALAELTRPEDVRVALQRDQVDPGRVWSLAMNDQFKNGHALLEGGLDPKVQVFGAYLKDGPVSLFRALTDLANDVSYAFPEGLLAAAVRKGAPTEERDAQGRTPLLAAVSKGYRPSPDRWPQLLVELAGSGADVNAQDLNGDTALHFAVKRGTWDKVSAALVTAGANVNQPNKAGEPPLVAAARAGRADSVELLLKAGADLNQRSGRAQLPAWLQVALALPQRSSAALDNASQQILDKLAAAPSLAVDLNLPGVREGLDTLGKVPHLASFARRLARVGGVELGEPAPIGQVVLRAGAHVFSYDGAKLYRDNVDISRGNLAGMVPVAAGDKLLLLGKSSAAIAYAEAQPLAGYDGISSVVNRGTAVFDLATSKWTRAGFINAQGLKDVRVEGGRLLATDAEGEEVNVELRRLVAGDLLLSSFAWGPRVDLAQPVPFSGAGSGARRNLGGGLVGTVAATAKPLSVAVGVLNESRYGSYTAVKEAGGYGITLPKEVAASLTPGSALARQLVRDALERNTLLDIDQPRVSTSTDGVRAFDASAAKDELRWYTEASGIGRALDLASQEDDGSRTATGLRVRDAVDLAARWVTNDAALRMVRVEFGSFYGGRYVGLVGVDDATGQVRVFAVKSGGL